MNDVAITYFCGLGVMMATAPIIHPFNVVAAAAAKVQTTSPYAAGSVYSGLGGNAPNRFANFWNGLPGHISKEVVRSFGRIGGFMYVEPAFKERFSPTLAPHFLAMVMATYEVIFANPADVWKSYRSTGMPTKMDDLFKGSFGNYWRQYMMWFVWSSSIPPITRWLTSMEIDATSNVGIAMRSVMQSGICTLFTYPTELVLRTVQVRASEYPVRNLRDSLSFSRSCLTNPGNLKDSAYVRVLGDLIKSNGIRGLGLGMTSKFVGNAILLGGANFLPKLTAYAKEKR